MELRYFLSVGQERAREQWVGPMCPGFPRMWQGAWGNGLRLVPCLWVMALGRVFLTGSPLR